MRHRTQKASSVFCKWKPLLCNPNLSLKRRMEAFGASTLSSATWLSGCWTLSKQEQLSESWCARLLSQMVGFKRNPHDNFATFWRKLHRRRHEMAKVFAVSPVDVYLRAKHRLAGHFARFESDNPVCQMVCRNLAWWRKERSMVELTRRGFKRGAGNRVWSGRTGVRGWSVVETHGQWVGLRLRRTSGFQRQCLSFSVPQLDCGGSLASLWERPAPVCCPATHSSRNPATGDLMSTSERKRKRVRERERVK